MVRLGPYSTLNVPYDVPNSGIMQVRVFGDNIVNVLVVQRRDLESYRKNEEFSAHVNSQLAKEHQFLIQLPRKTSWNLIIENPYDRLVEVQSTVVEMFEVIK